MDFQAKGYPDIASRSFLRLLSVPSFRNGYSKPIVSCLVDFDPDGLAIYSNYKHGSVALAHENACLNVSAIELLGVKSDVISALSATDNAHEERGLLRLSPRDRRKARALVDRQVDASAEHDPRLIRDLQSTLMLNVKVEIQILEASNGGLSQWLISRIDFLRKDRYSC